MARTPRWSKDQDGIARMDLAVTFRVGMKEVVWIIGKMLSEDRKTTKNSVMEYLRCDFKASGNKTNDRSNVPTAHLTLAKKIFKDLFKGEYPA